MNPYLRYLKEILGSITKPQEETDMGIIIASHNIGDGENSKKRENFRRFKAHGVQIIGVQEAGDRGGVLAESGYHEWDGIVPGSDSVPLLYNGVNVTREFDRLAVGPRFVGQGAGPSMAKPKAINGIRANGIDILNTHFIASADNPTASQLRGEHYRDHAQVLTQMVERRLRKGRPVIVTGDFNGAPNNDRLAGLRRLGMRQIVNQATHGERILDHIWISQNLEAEYIQVFQVFSDHKTPIAKIRKRRDGKRK